MPRPRVAQRRSTRSNPARRWRRSRVATTPRSKRQATSAIVTDTGGTSYDVSLVAAAASPSRARPGSAGRSRGHMTGFPSVDVKSIGAGGGSIAWVDDGGLLHVGPQSAGADARARMLRPRRRASRRSPTPRWCSAISIPSTSSAARCALDAAAARRRDRAVVAQPLGLECAGRRCGDPRARDRAYGPRDRGDHGQPGHRPARAPCSSAAAARPA